MGFPFDALTWGIRGLYRLTAPILSDGESGDLQLDVNGNLKSRIVGGPVINGYDVVVVPVTSRVARAVPCALVELWGHNDDTSQDLYLQLFNKATPASAGATPFQIFRVPAGQHIAFEPGTPLPFGAGIAWAVSTTPGVLTAPSSGGGFVLTVAYQ